MHFLHRDCETEIGNVIIQTYAISKQNKAGYTASPVACGWAGAVFELLKHLGKCSEAKDRKNIKKVKWGPTDRPTDQRTDKAGCSVA